MFLKVGSQRFTSTESQRNYTDPSLGVPDYVTCDVIFKVRV